MVQKINTVLRRSPDRVAMFRATCFGVWTDFQCKHGDPLLVHVMLQRQIPGCGERGDEIWFHARNMDVKFGREEFCLITGMRFGADEEVKHLVNTPFRNRIHNMLPEVKSKLRAQHLWRILNSDKFDKMRDDDAIRVALLYLVVRVFAGRQNEQVIPEDYLHLIEDLDTWNKYPWGSHFWKLTWPVLYDALAKPGRNPQVNPIPAKKSKNNEADNLHYTLQGFIYAFKV